MFSQRNYFQTFQIFLSKIITWYLESYTVHFKKFVNFKDYWSQLLCRCRTMNNFFSVKETRIFLKNFFNFLYPRSKGIYDFGFFFRATRPCYVFGYKIPAKTDATRDGSTTCALAPTMHNDSIVTRKRTLLITPWHFVITRGLIWNVFESVRLGIGSRAVTDENHYIISLCVRFTMINNSYAALSRFPFEY